MVETLYQVVGNKDEIFAHVTGGLVRVLSAWDAGTGWIPIVWTRHGDGMW